MKNKKGKKLVVLGAMAALLTLIGVSGSQTYAKYVESTTVDAKSATVAKWGFVIHNNVDNLFGLKHDTTDTPTTGTSSVSNSGESIVASGTSSLVAPGSYGYMTFDIQNESEVKASIDFSLVAGYQDITLTKGGKTYTPLKWTLEESTDGLTYSIVEDELGNEIKEKTLTELAGLIDCASFEVAANEASAHYVRISYIWEFDGSAQNVEGLTNDSSAKYTYDELDTI